MKAGPIALSDPKLGITLELSISNGNVTGLTKPLGCVGGARALDGFVTSDGYMSLQIGQEGGRLIGRFEGSVFAGTLVARGEAEPLGRFFFTTLPTAADLAHWRDEAVRCLPAGEGWAGREREWINACVENRSDEFRRNVHDQHRDAIAADVGVRRAFFSRHRARKDYYRAIVYLETAAALFISRGFYASGSDRAWWLSLLVQTAAFMWLFNFVHSNSEANLRHKEDAASRR